MSENLRLDTAQMATTGAALETAASQLSYTVHDDVTGCGSQAVELAIQEFAMRVALDLRGASEELQVLGSQAKDAASAVEETDRQLARAVG